MLEEIPLKGSTIVLRDVNQLTEDQLNKIRKVSNTKTPKEWFECDSDEVVKLEITDEQKLQVLKTKDYILSSKRPKDLYFKEIVRFTDHAKRRIAQRIEGKGPDSNVSPKMFREVIKMIRDSQVVLNEAEWKGDECLRYNLKGILEGKEYIITIAFEDEVCIVTIIDPKNEHIEYGFNLKNLLSQETIAKMKNKK